MAGKRYMVNIFIVVLCPVSLLCIQLSVKSKKNVSTNLYIFEYFVIAGQIQKGFGENPAEPTYCIGYLQLLASTKLT